VAILRDSKNPEESWSITIADILTLIATKSPGGKLKWIGGSVE
jgi:hypothetical protein